MKHNVPSPQTLYQKLSGSPFKILMLLAVLFASSIGSLIAATINVPGANGPTIQAAVNAAVAGDIILVAPGTYNENVTITKSLTLISSGGAGSTIINGSAPGLGSIVLAANINNITIGGSGQGFTINGYDSPSPGLEYAALYIAGIHDNVIISGNTIVANGEAGLLTEYSNDVNNLTVVGNTFSGKTFVGATPAGCGFSQQFDIPNVPRFLVYIAKGTGLLFSNNNITGTAGGTSAEAGCTTNGQGQSLVAIFGNIGSNATVCGNSFAGTTARFGTSLRIGSSAGPTTNVSIKNNTFNSAGLMGSATFHLSFIANSIADPNTIAGVASMNIFTPEGYYTAGGTNILKNSAQAGAGAIAANSGPIANASCPTCLGTTPPNLFTAFPGDARVPAGQQSATVCQNSGDVTFQFDNCIGGTVNWSGTNGSNGTGSIVATSAAVGTVTYSATCTIGQCISAASQVTVTVTALPTVTPGPNKSVVFTPTPGSNCTLISAQGNGGAGNYTYNWTSSNPAELPFTGQNPQVCPTVTTVYTVKATDANGCTSAPAQVTVTVKDVRCGPNNQNVTICYYGVTQCVTQSLATRYMKLGATLGSCGSARIGVEEKAAEAVLELSVKAYPNPTTGALTVQVNSPAAGIAQLDVLDVAGRAVQQRSHQLSEGLNEVEFNLGGQAQGTYLIRCRDVLGRQAVVRVQKQ